MGTSLKDIAERLNVSKTTVSWTLSGQGDKKHIGRETQERVLQCAREMNYQPNLLARSLNSGQTNTLGLIIPDITDSFYSTIARQVEMEAEKRGYSLMIASSESDQEREDRILSLFCAKQVDGIIIAPTRRSKVMLSNLVKRHFPLVAIDRFFTDLTMNSITVNNHDASRNVVRGMIKRGARHIAILTTNPHLFTMNERRRGYEDALREGGLEVTETLYGEVSFDNYEEEIFDVMDRIYHQNPRVDGFFFTTHILAIEVFRYFHERGINVNVGYQLGCIHGISAFKALAPGMRVARMPVEEIGANAVRIVTECIDCGRRQERRPFERMVLECTYPTDLSEMQRGYRKASLQAATHRFEKDGSLL
jgi:LacI family transcriptional regulator